MIEDDELVTCDVDFSPGEYIRRTVFDFEKHRRLHSRPHYSHLLREWAMAA